MACVVRGYWCGEDVTDQLLSATSTGVLGGGFAWGALLEAGDPGTQLRVLSGGGYVPHCVVQSVAACAASWEHLLVATADGELHGAGWNSEGQAVPCEPAEAVPNLLRSGWRPPRPVRQLACGEQHSLLLTADGACFAWGLNSNGQLGSGARLSTRTPALLASLPPVKAIAAGARHSLALSLDGAAFSWGWGLYGQLGSGGNEDALQPMPVASLAGLVVVGASAGDAHSMFLTTDGDAYAAGSNAHGQLGLGEEACAMVPELVEGVLSIAVVACGARHTMFLSKCGELKACGWNGHGQLCAGLGEVVRAPAEVAQVVEAVACGHWHTLLRRGSTKALHRR